MEPFAWTPDKLNETVRGFQASAVIVAAAELEIFDTMAGGAFTASQASEKLQADLRGLTILLDALAALGLLAKTADKYTIPPATSDILSARGARSMLAMTQHQAACLRKWARLAEVVKTGKPAPRDPGIRGANAEYASFIEAMDNIGRQTAAKLLADLQLPKFTHLLDVGGASGTYTIAFLKSNPAARATIFDLPHVLPQARQRLENAGLAHRVTLAGGDFYKDPLPRGADLVWLSAIIHQNSRQQNRSLFKLCFDALVPGGNILVRDFLMEESHTSPVGGALFAVNMLVATDQGGTYTVGEVEADLATAGFVNARTLRRDDTMHSVLAATRP